MFRSRLLGQFEITERSPVLTPEDETDGFQREPKLLVLLLLASIVGTILDYLGGNNYTFFNLSILRVKN